MRVLAKFPDVPAAKGPARNCRGHQRGKKSSKWSRTVDTGCARPLCSPSIRACGRASRAPQVRDIDFERGLVFMRRAFSENILQDRPKDDDERVIPIAELARAQLEEAARRLKPEDFLVTNRNGKTPTRQAVWLAFNAVQIKAGLDRRFGVQALRHGFCTELVRDNVGVETVRVLAGHEDLRTTQRYLHAERPDLVSAMETFATTSRRLQSPRCALATVVEMTGGPNKKSPAFGSRGFTFFLFSRGGQICPHHALSATG